MGMNFNREQCTLEEHCAYALLAWQNDESTTLTADDHSERFNMLVQAYNDGKRIAETYKREQMIAEAAAAGAAAVCAAAAARFAKHL